MGYLRARNLEKTGFQESRPWSAPIDVGCDFVMVYGLDHDMPQRIAQYRQQGYVVHLMCGIAWGNYHDYLDGRFDGRNHWDEAQATRDGQPILHEGGIPYMVPTIAFCDYLTQGLRAAVDAGVEALHMEEPEFWDRAGYSKAFQREYQLYYREPWQPPHSSVDAHWRCARLKAYLYARAIDRIGSALKEYAMVRYGRALRFYVPTHSLINYTQWKIVSPEGALLDLPCVDGYIAQVWTGTSRAANMYAGLLAERTFETAFLEYGVMQELARASGRRMWFLHDPIEDSPEYAWEDYRRNYLKTLVASLLHPAVSDYEICPWPTRVFCAKYPRRIWYKGGGELPDAKGIPPCYATFLCSMFQLLGDMQQEQIHFDRPDFACGIAVSDTALYQRAYPDGLISEDTARRADSLLKGYDPAHPDSQTSLALSQLAAQDVQGMAYFIQSAALPHFYGLALPLVKCGLGARPVLLDNVRRYADYLAPYRLLVVSYEWLKPLSPDINNALAAWVRQGGLLLYVGDDSDPYHHVRAWWNQGQKPYPSARAHLMEMLGLAQDAREGIYPVGRGRVGVFAASPAHLGLNAQAAQGYLQRVQALAGEPLPYGSHFLLRRGPYMICAALDEISQQMPEGGDQEKSRPPQADGPLCLRGLFVDLAAADYPIITQKAVAPGSQALLMDLQQVKEELRVVASAARIEELGFEKGRLLMRARAAGGIRATIRLKLPHDPGQLHAWDEQGHEMPLQSAWDEVSHTLLVAWQSANQALRIQSQMS